MSSSPLVRLKKAWLVLQASSGPVEALRGLDLQLLAGETMALTGPSGSGKTSALMLIAGLEKPTHGEVLFQGQNIARHKEDQLADMRRNSMGIVFQDFHLIPVMTALENVLFPLELSFAADAKDRATQALADMGLENRLHHYPGQLSGGERQRVALARAVAGAPKLLLADEPTGNLDRANGTKIADLLFSMAEKNQAALLLITHDPNLAKRCGSRLELVDGKAS